MTHTEELREEIKQAVKAVIFAEGYYNRLESGVNKILAKLKELNYQKVMESRAKRNSDSFNKTWVISESANSRPAFKYCEPIEL